MAGSSDDARTITDPSDPFWTGCTDDCSDDCAADHRGEE